MKFIYSFLVFILVLAQAHGQTLCTKFSVIKPKFATESVKVLVTPATYKVEYQQMIIKPGFWDVTYSNNLPCKTWKDAETKAVLVQIVDQPAVYQDILVLKKERDGEVISYLSDN
jgi:hypothetical protein